MSNQKMNEILEGLNISREVDEAEWKTMNGAHVLIDNSGSIVAGGGNAGKRKKLSKSAIKAVATAANKKSKSDKKEEKKESNNKVDVKKVHDEIRKDSGNIANELSKKSKNKRISQQDIESEVVKRLKKSGVDSDGWDSDALDTREKIESKLYDMGYDIYDEDEE